MAAWDYSADLETARQMIAETGRLVALKKGASGLADANDPLAGPGVAPDPVTGVPAVFVYPSGLVNLGASATMAQLFKDCEKIAIVAWDGTNDFSDFDFIVDADGKNWKIINVETLQPGDTIILYYIGVKRP